MKNETSDRARKIAVVDRLFVIESFYKYKKRGVLNLRFIDDVLYVAGWMCIIAACIGVDWRLGALVGGAALEITAFIFAKWRGGKG